MKGRPSIGRYLNRTLTVHRPQNTDDGHGGQDTQLVAVGTVRAKVDQPSVGERSIAASSNSRHSHDIYLLPRADVRRGDELTGTDHLGIAQRFRVQSVVQPSTPVYSKALVELIQTEGEPANG